MLHIITQYRALLGNLFTSKVGENLSSAPESSNNNESISIKDALSNALEDKSLSQEEARQLLERLY